MSKPLPYGPTDDKAALSYIREALSLSQRGNWEALLADDRVLQTYRALKAFDAKAGERSVRERDAIKLAEHQRYAGLITAAEYADHYRQFTTWRKRASRFNTVLHQYLDLRPPTASAKSTTTASRTRCGPRCWPWRSPSTTTARLTPERNPWPTPPSGLA
ncbi:hypothetical protein [Amycolatopsis sp. NPDC051071]|uniref:hypothetical protein n=1 Tax=Amycolatopsis sp. NPDC051071 TaxID=3154637 RepID=UPI0034160411